MMFRTVQVKGLEDEAYSRELEAIAIMQEKKAQAEISAMETIAKADEILNFDEPTSTT